jgi:hypothetical protein
MLKKTQMHGELDTLQVLEAQMNMVDLFKDQDQTLLMLIPTQLDSEECKMRPKVYKLPMKPID